MSKRRKAPLFTEKKPCLVSGACSAGEGVADWFAFSFVASHGLGVASGSGREEKAKERNSRALASRVVRFFEPATTATNRIPRRAAEATIE